MAEKPGRRPIFGPLTYATLVITALVYTGNRLRPWASAHYRCWSLLRQLRSPNLPDRSMIEESFAQEIHPSTEYWLDQALKDPDPLVSAFARELDLKLHEGSPRTIRSLIRSLDSGDPLEIPTILKGVAQLCLRLGIRLPNKERRELVKTIVSLLDRNDPSIRKAAAQTLASFAFDLDLSHDRLHGIAENDSDHKVRMQALSTIAMIDRDQNHRVKALLDQPLDPGMPQDQFESFNYSSVNDLMSIIGAKKTYDALAPLLNDSDTSRRYRAIRMIDTLARLERRSSRDLSDPRTQSTGIDPLEKDEPLDRKHIVRAIADRLDDSESIVRISAALFLGEPLCAGDYPDKAAIERAVRSAIWNRDLPWELRVWGFRWLFDYAKDSAREDKNRLIEEIFADDQARAHHINYIISQLLMNDDFIAKLPGMLERAKTDLKLRKAMRESLSFIQPSAIRELDRIEGKSISNDQTEDAEPNDQP